MYNKNLKGGQHNVKKTAGKRDINRKGGKFT